MNRNHENLKKIKKHKLAEITEGKGHADWVEFQMQRVLK